MGTEASPIPSSLGTACPQSPPSLLCGLRGRSGTRPSPVSDAVWGVRSPLSHGPYAVRASQPLSCLGCSGYCLWGGILYYIHRQPFGFLPGTKCFNHMVRDTVRLCPFIGLKTYSPSTILQYLDWVRSASLGCSKFVAGSSLRELKEAVLPQSAGLTWVIPKSPQPQRSWGRSLRGERCFILTVFVLNGFIQLSDKGKKISY